jgi:murein endopeptidase
MNDALLNIAIEWHSSFPREQLLFINDMSLPYGGLFDVNGDWKTPHKTHRIGKSADIRTELPGRRTGAPVRTPRNATD